MPIVRNTKGHEQVHVSNISDVTLTTDGLESLQTAGNATLSSIEGKIPSALTGSGNLKVCIQELGNEGSERLNVDVGTAIAQLPTALTGEGNLKVSIQEDFTHLLALEATQAASLLKHTAIDNKLPAALTGSGNLKVCLQELGNEGSERLNVDIGSTNTKLPTALTGSGNLKVSIQEHFNSGLGTETTLSAMSAKLPTALDSGNLKVSSQLNSSEAQTNTNMVIAINSEGSLEINTTGFRKVRISGVSSTTDPLVLMCSTTSGGTLMAFDTLNPVARVYDSSGAIQNTFSKLIECPPTFIKIRNPMSYTITILSSNIKMIN